MNESLILTEAGAAEIEAAYLAGTVVNIVTAAFGDGGGAPVIADPSVTALVGQFGEEPFSSGGNDVGMIGGSVVIQAQTYPGQTLREFGLMSEADTLIAYGAYPDTLLPAETDSVVKEVTVYFVMPLVHAESVTLVVDPNIAIITQEEGDKRYLRQALRLQEIADQGEEAQSEAREHLALGSAATHDVTTFHADTTAGRVLQVGDGGLLGAEDHPMGMRSQFLAYPGTRPEVPLYGAGWQASYGVSARAQAYIGGGGLFHSRFSASEEPLDADTPWATHYTTENKPTVSDVGAAPVEIARFVTPEMFLVTGDYASDSAAINACAEYARANGLSVLGSAVYTVTEDLLLSGISWRGGIFKGSGEEKIICFDSDIERVEFDAAYLHIMGGKCRITRNKFHDQTSTAALLIQGMTSQGHIEVSNNEFHHCNFAILQQGTGEIMLSGRYAGNYIHDIYGDGIELNVVNAHYPQGLIIESNIISNVDSALSPAQSTPNWGIGIGIAGKGPYGIDIDDGMYASGFTIRGNKITGCRQCIHTEVCRDFTVVDNECYPDVSKSADAGLYLAACASYGCKSFTIDGMSGEPMGNARRFILLDWGVNSGVYDAPPRNFVVRNVTTQTGDIEITTAGANDWTNSTILENIRCNILQWRGLPPVSVFRNIFCNTLDCIGQHAFGEGSGGGVYSRSHYTYTNWSNVICLGDASLNTAVSKMYVERCDQSGNNFVIPIAEDGAGHRGARLFSVVEQYLLEDDVFPGGRYFEKGTVLWKASGAGGFKVTVAGSHIKTSGTTTDKIKATAVGDTFIRANGIQWADGEGAKSSGTRLRIPGAGDAGADLIATIIRSAYVANSVWTVDISPPISTATAENIQIFAAEPVEYIEI